MKALLRKELIQVLAVGAVPFVPLCLYWIDLTSRARVLIIPDGSAPDIAFALAGIAGLLLGYFQFSIEQWMGHADYLRHRGTSRRRLFATKVLAGLLGTAALSVLPLVVLAALFRIFSANGPLIRGVLVLEPVCTATVGFATYGLGVLASQIRRHPMVELLLLGAGVAGLVLVAAAAVAWGPERLGPALATFALVHVGLGAALLVVARRLFVEGVDRELPLRSGTHGALAFLAIPLWFLPATELLTNVQSGSLEGARHPSALLLQDPASGEVFAAAHNGRGEFRRVDEDGDFVEAASPFGLYDEKSGNRKYEILSWSHAELSGTWPSLSLPRSEWEDLSDYRVHNLQPAGATMAVLRSGEALPRAFLDRDAGVICVLGLRQGYGGPAAESVAGREVPFEIELKRPDGRRFSPQTRVVIASLEVQLANTGDSLRYCILDPADGKAWRFESLALEDALVAIQLPGGDRWIRFEGVGRRAVALPWGRARWEATELQDLVVGERGKYAWDGTQFREEAGEGSPSPSTIAVLVTDEDPLRTRVELRKQPGDELVLEHVYRPRTTGQHLFAGAAHVLSALRPPVANLIAPDPLLARRPLLLAVSLAVGLGSAAWLALRLRRSRAHPTVTAIWSALALLIGPLALAVARLHEARRAKAAPAEESAAARSLLIETAAS